MTTQTSSACARVGLLGNPSDLYGGKCLSYTIDRRAWVSVSRHDGNFPLVRSEEDVGVVLTEDSEYGGRHDLILALVKKLDLFNEQLLIKYSTEIPVGAGLAGSSAILIAMTRALNGMFGWDMEKSEIAEIALRAELDELGIAAGFQDRYSISHGGITYMDFTGKERMHEDDPYGVVTDLGEIEIPFFLCFSHHPKASSMVHNPVRRRYERGDKAIERAMREIAGLAEQGAGALKARDWQYIGRLMRTNTALRTKAGSSLKTDLTVIQRMIGLGALGAKVAGSGGAIVVLTEEEELQTVFSNASREYPCMRPTIVYPRDGA